MGLFDSYGVTPFWMGSNYLWGKRQNVTPAGIRNFLQEIHLTHNDSIMKAILDTFVKSNYSQGTRASRDQPGLRMTNTLHQSDRENLRHPASSYKYRGLLHYVASPIRSYRKKYGRIQIRYGKYIVFGVRPLD